MTAIRAFVSDKRTANDFLRAHGADLAAEVRHELLDELESVLCTLPAREYTIQEAADATGVHPESIRRLVRKGKLGRQSGKGCAMFVSAADLSKLHCRATGKTQGTPGSSRQVVFPLPVCTAVSSVPWACSNSLPHRDAVAHAANILSKGI